MTPPPSKKPRLSETGDALIAVDHVEIVDQPTLRT
jgi:hypothetical protein